MCGIFGVWNRHKSVSPASVHRAATLLHHRGPDDEGYLFFDTDAGDHTLAGGYDTPKAVYSSPYAYSPRKNVEKIPEESGYNLAFAHRRLSIIDLSPSGHQPMCNEDGTIWIIYNGEIYNFHDLRDQLKALGHRFVSQTDTEVILHAYEEWGVEALPRFNGMWAFCILDMGNRKLFCARDRFGVKPFHYYVDEKRFIFSSEIKALLKTGIPRKPNDGRLYDFLASSIVDHTSETFFEGVKRLNGGEYLHVDMASGGLTAGRYWDLDLSRKDHGISHEELTERFYHLLQDSVRLRLISDVPVGTCLSGGLDSSTIVCLVDKLMREEGTKIPGTDIQKTFSARYEDSRHDEGAFINEVVKKTGVDARSIVSHK